MISTQFKKTVIKLLKNDYDITCHAISMSEHEHATYQEYSLSCSSNRKVFFLTLLVTICPVDSSSNLHTFYIFSKSDCVDCIPQFKEKIKHDLIIDAMKEVRHVLSYIDPVYNFQLEHVRVTLISGIYFVGSSYFEIKTIKSLIEAASVVKVYDFSNSGKVCSNVDITGNLINLQPWKLYGIHPTFEEFSIVDMSGLETFKSNLAKSIVLFFNENHKTADDYNDEESDYMPLNYDDLKRYLLVHTMANI